MFPNKEKDNDFELNVTLSILGFERVQACWEVLNLHNQDINI